MRKTAIIVMLVVFSSPASSDEKILKTHDSSGRVVFTNAPAHKTTVARSSVRNVYKWRDASGRVVYGYLHTAPPRAKPVRIDQSLNESEPADLRGTEGPEKPQSEIVRPRPPVIRPLVHAVETPDQPAGLAARAYRTSGMRQDAANRGNGSRLSPYAPAGQGDLALLQSRYGSWPVIGRAVVLFLALIGLGVLLQKVLLTPWQRSTMQDPSNEESAP